MSENFVNWFQQILSVIPALALLGIMHLAFIERELIFVGLKKFQGKNKQRIKDFRPILDRLAYIILGIVITYSSYIIIFVLDIIFVPGGIISKNGEIGIIAGTVPILLWMACGVSLMLSAGGRWLVNLAKLFITLAIVVFFVAAYWSYL